jgi:hypothetical protein
VFCIGFNFRDFLFYGREPKNWIFNNDVYFQKCKFENLCLQKMIFNKNTYFGDAIFNGNTELNFCTFKGNVSFENVSMNKEFILRASFAGDIMFHNCKFKGLTKFNINSNLPKYEKLTFWECIFFNTLPFYGSQFKGKNLFETCTFNDKVDFNQVYFYNHTVYKDYSTIEFRYCLFNEVEFIESYFPTYNEKVLSLYKTPRDLPENFSFGKEDLRRFFNDRYNTDFKECHYTDISPWKLQVSTYIIKFNLIDKIKNKL